MTGEQRRPTHEEQLELTEEINLALQAHYDAVYAYGCWVMSDGATLAGETYSMAWNRMYAPIRDARSRVEIAIAARVKEVREGTA